MQVTEIHEKNKMKVLFEFALASKAIMGLEKDWMVSVDKTDKAISAYYGI